jgi:predicted DNA-binding transcriptional regulator AlpA
MAQRADGGPRRLVIDVADDGTVHVNGTLIPADGAGPHPAAPRDDTARDDTASGRLWTIEDVADYLGVGSTKARRVVSEPGFPGRIRLGHKVHRWLPADVHRWARSHKEETVEPPREVDTPPRSRPHRRISAFGEG